MHCVASAHAALPYRGISEHVLPLLCLGQLHQHLKVLAEKVLRAPIGIAVRQVHKLFDHFIRCDGYVFHISGNKKPDIRKRTSGRTLSKEEIRGHWSGPGILHPS